MIGLTVLGAARAELLSIQVRQADHQKQIIFLYDTLQNAQAEAARQGRPACAGKPHARSLAGVIAESRADSTRELLCREGRRVHDARGELTLRPINSLNLPESIPPSSMVYELDMTQCLPARIVALANTRPTVPRANCYNSSFLGAGLTDTPEYWDMDDYKTRIAALPKLEGRPHLGDIGTVVEHFASGNFHIEHAFNWIVDDANDHNAWVFTKNGSDDDRYYMFARLSDIRCLYHDPLNGKIPEDAYILESYRAAPPIPGPDLDLPQPTGDRHPPRK